MGGDAGSPDATVRRGVLDTRHTAPIASLSEACEPAEARRLARHLEWQATPTHGRGVNMAASAVSVLRQPCLDRRRPAAATRTRDLAAWAAPRHAAQANHCLALLGP